ncbi:hypothetical protein ACI2KS_10115 [Pseudomonas sp. NPDC087358]|uniref:hypothetical protein n=1 Tax=Pseudomonas sp. NPDC087358 TaxID=3364439 RepID=UPI003850E248
MTMICGNCNKFGIRWVGPFGNLAGTECPHCGGTNCQQEAEAEEEELETATCGCGATGEVNYDDGTERRFYCYSSLSMCSP